MKYLILFFLIINPAWAKEIRMVQVDKTFLGDITEEQAAQVFDDPSIEEKHKVEELKLQQGDVILFINRDEVAHNVSGTTGEKVVFDVKLQEPGKANDKKIVLDKKGEFTVQCAIHPKMKIKVKVD